MELIETLKRRLERIGINTTYSSNPPWIYLDTVNGKRVKEKYYSKYFFCISFLPIKEGKVQTFIDIPKLFEVIRKYI